MPSICAFSFMEGNIRWKIVTNCLVVTFFPSLDIEWNQMANNRLISCTDTLMYGLNGNAIESGPRYVDPLDEISLLVRGRYMSARSYFKTQNFSKETKKDRTRKGTEQRVALRIRWYEIRARTSITEECIECFI